MPVRIEAYLALERSLADRLARSWLQMAKTLVPSIIAALRDQDYVEAEKLIAEIDLEDVFEENREYVRYITISAMLFGASRLTPEVKRTALARLGANEVVEAAVENLRASVVGFVEDSIRDLLMDLVAEFALADETAPLADSETQVAKAFNPDQARDEGGKWTSGGASSKPVSEAASGKYFAAVESIPRTEDITAAEEAWQGGVADFGDPNAAFAILQMDGYDDYRSQLEKAARSAFGDQFPAYRLMTDAQAEEWKTTGDVGPVAVTLDPDLAEKFKNFAGFQGDPSRAKERKVFEVQVRPEGILMAGKPEELELVVHSSWTSSNEILPYKKIAKAFNPDEARDASGKWTADGSVIPSHSISVGPKYRGKTIANLSADVESAIAASGDDNNWDSFFGSDSGIRTAEAARRRVEAVRQESASAGSKDKPPPYGAPLSAERSQYLLWQDRNTLADGEKKLSKLIGRDEEKINWDKEWGSDTRVRSVAEARAELEDLRKRISDRQSAQKAERFVNPFVSFRERAESQAANTLQLVATLHASRLSAYGFTAEADVLNVSEYEISAQLDNRVCPICEYMDGKVFRVADARASLNEILREKNPEALETLQPWPDQSKDGVEYFQSLSDEELVDKNWHIPPFHPGCRCLLVHVDTVPSVTSTPSYLAAMGGGVGVDAIDVAIAAEEVVQQGAVLVAAEQTAVAYVLGQLDSAGREYGMAFNPKTGEALKQWVGGSNQIRLNPKVDGPLLLGARFVHNHPSSYSLSIADFRVTGHYEMDSIVAMGTDSSKFVGRVKAIPPELKTRYGYFINNLELQSDAINSEFLGPLVRSGRVTTQEAMRFFSHHSNDVLREATVVAYGMEIKGPLVSDALDKVAKLVDVTAMRTELRVAFDSVVLDLTLAQKQAFLWI